MIYQLRHDNDTFRLDVIHAPKPGTPPERKYLTLEQVKELFQQLDAQQHEQKTQWKRAFLLAVVILTSGERHHRYLLQRKTGSGARNIRMPIRHAVEYAEETLYAELIDKLRKKRERNKKETMKYEELATLIRDTLDPIKVKLGLPADDPVTYSYTIPENAANAASEACRTYLKRLKPQGILTEHFFKKVCDKLRADYPEDATAVIRVISATKNREHLSAISITSKDGQLVVSIVNQKGDLLSMEGWKLLRLIDGHGTALNLGTLDRKGAWLPEPVLELSKNRSGDLIGIYTAEDSTIQVVCRQETTNSQGKVRTDMPDRAAFILDQNYLVSLYVAIAQLKEDKKRFEDLREQAEAKKAVNIDDLFDPGLFEISRPGGHNHDEQHSRSTDPEPPGVDLQQKIAE